MVGEVGVRVIIKKGRANVVTKNASCQLNVAVSFTFW